MKKAVTCKRCGCTDLIWNESKNGKWYLAQSTPIHGEGGRHIKTIYPAHRCEDYLKRVAEDAEEIRIEREKAEKAKNTLDDLRKQYKDALYAGEFVRAEVILQFLQEQEGK